VGAGLRKPNTGTLHVKVIAVKQQNNAPNLTLKPPETLCMLKVDGVPRAKTRPARSGPQGAQWNEDFDLPVEKANEVELTLYDKPENHLIPIGILWVKISDITDELRRKKVELESGPGWAPAGVAGQGSGSENGEYEGSGRGFNNAPSNVTVDGIETWFDLEPVGQICLKFTFGTSVISETGFQVNHWHPVLGKCIHLISFHACCLALYSQGFSRCQTLPLETGPCRSCPQEKGRDQGGERTQVCCPTVLSDHALRPLLGSLFRCWCSMRR